MADFKYKATNASGKIQEGVINASDRRLAAAKLSQQGLRILQINSMAEGSVLLSKTEASAEIKGGEALALAFFKKLLQLCKGGMPMGDALKSLAQRSLNPSMKNLSKELYKNVSEGVTLASAMGAYPKLFEPSVIHLSEAGESTANLVPVFQNVISYLEGKKALRASVIKALAYPSFLVVMATGVVLFFLFYLMPMIQNMLSSMGGEVNLPVKILMFLGDFLIYGMPVILLITLCASLFVWNWRKKDEGKLACDRLILRLPLAGDIVRNADISRFTNLISTLFASGVNTTETFRLSEKTIKNTALKLNFTQCKTSINDGAPIAQSFKKYDLLDDDDIDILSVGERTGSMVECFFEVYHTHMETLDSQIKNATKILTSVALLGAVVIIFLVAIGIVSSVFSLSQSLN